MAKVSTQYVCSNCGAKAPQMIGRCPVCGEWGTYEEEVDPWDLENDNVMCINLGVNNFATVVTSEESPYVVDGRFLKNQIYFKCKIVSKLQSILNKQD